MKIFSEEWAQTLADKINSNKEFLSSAEVWTISIVLALTEDASEKSVFINLENGKCKSANPASPQNTESAGFIITASKESWEKLLTGKLDPMMAVMTKKLELKKGNVSELLKYIDAAKQLFNSAKQVATEF
jgi:putative sterol carrier protein